MAYIITLILAGTILLAASTVRCTAVDLSTADFDRLEKVGQEIILRSRSIGDQPVLNIKELGAVGDGKHNDTKPFFEAMVLASEIALDFKIPVLIPEGTFLMWPVNFPCVNVRLEVQGTVIAPQNPDEWTQNEHFWRIDNANNCTITGYASDFGPQGEISGRGAEWWERRQPAPSLILFKGVTNRFEAYPIAKVANITLSNAPGAHIAVHNTSNYYGPNIDNVVIYSPRGSYGTVGVLGINCTVSVSHSNIATGDDNIRLVSPRGNTHEVFLSADRNTIGHGNGITLVVYDGVMGNMSFFYNKFTGSTYGFRFLGVRDGSGAIANVQAFTTEMEDVGVPLYMSNAACPEPKTDPCTGNGTGEEKYLLYSM